MRLRARLFTLALGASLWAASAAPSLAADNATVAAHVDVATPCITVSTSTLNFGTLSFSTPGVNPVSSVQAVSYTNCGGTAEKVFGHGTNANQANGTIVWSLVPPIGNCDNYGGPNKYGLVLHTPDTLTYTLLSNTDQLLETVAAGGTGAKDHEALFMPCAGSNGAGQTMNFQTVFTATF